MDNPSFRSTLDPWGCDSLVQNHPTDVPVFSVQDRWPSETRPVNTADNYSSETDVAIVGGGIIGCGIAAHLINILGLDRVAIFEPRSWLLQQLYDRIHLIDQGFMRSPFYVHIAPDGDLALLDVARLSWPDLTAFERNQVRYALGRQRALVSSDLFFRHSNYIVKMYGLQDRTSRIKVLHVTKNRDNTWQVVGQNGQVTRARVVILCTGGTPKDRSNLHKRQFDPFDRLGYQLAIQDKKATVVGGGISAFHSVTKLVYSGASVQWRIRRPLEYRCFDFDPIYARKEGQLWLENADPIERAQAISRDKRGTLPPELASVLERETYQARMSICVMNEMLNRDNDWSRNGVTILATGLKGDDSISVSSADDRQASTGTAGDKTAGLYYAGLAAAHDLGPASGSVEGVRLFIEKNIDSISHVLERKFKQRSQFMNVTGHAAIT